MDWPNCVRCDGSRTVPGGMPGELEPFFRVDASIAHRRSWMSGVNHDVPLEEIGWLCLDCGLAWQQTDERHFESFHSTLREKCRDEYASRLFGEDDDSVPG